MSKRTTYSETFLFLGDMYARHHLWREEIDNQKGKIFEEMLTEKDIILLSINEPTYFRIKTDHIQPSGK